MNFGTEPSGLTFLMVAEEANSEDLMATLLCLADRKEKEGKRTSYCHKTGWW